MKHDNIDALALAGSRFGTLDVPCPICGPGCKRPANRRRPVLRIWRDKENFASYSCARCHIKGFTLPHRAGISSTALLPERENGKAQQQKDEAGRQTRALELWREAEPLGDLAHRYFALRRIPDLSALPDIHSVLRLHRRCPFGPGERLPCILALWTDALTGEPKAIHRTALTAAVLTADGTKPERKSPERKSLGPCKGCVIRLWPDCAVELGLVIGEGIETVLSAATRIAHRGTTLLQPAWAAGDEGHIRDFPVLAGIDALTILVDNDHNQAGQRAAHECGQRWRAANREVRYLTPNQTGDFNDIVRAS